MKRLCALMVLMLLSSSADAGTFSFSYGGHHYRIEAPRGCRSTSCASISTSDKKRDDDTRNVAGSPPQPAPAPVQVAPPVAPAPAPVQQVAPPVQKPVIAAAPAPAPVAVYKPAAVATTEVAPPLPPVPQAPQQVIVTQPCPAPPAEKRDEAVRPAPAPVPPVLKVLHEEDVDSPIGDWQTEGRGMVRISECGRSLCGYAIKDDDGEKGEAILVNMKSKSDQQWGGSVYSKDSGDTYYGTMRLKGPNMLRVEACAFGRFYCNGNNWTRITQPRPMMTSRHVVQEPRS